ncbi:MAG: GTP-binding protein [Chloroflexi bacterium]|jgi:small GTP-binding protein|nr:GTP-binding protein [Chloroflexota bacterium]
MQILSKQQDTLLKEERNLLRDLRVTLANMNAPIEDQTALEESIQQLDDFFLLVIVGEFNAGKSAFINALLGTRILKEGVTPTTTQVNVLRYGENQDRQIVDDHLHILTAPVDFLNEISIVDTPGTNAIIREHENITSKFVPRSDLVLFITSADRPFTESERLFLEKIRDWGKKVVIIINKIDILQNDDDLAQIQDFLSENARLLLGITPDIYPISARKALQAKQGEPHLWIESRFEPLEKFIHDTLDEGSRLRLKFLNPLGVGKHLTERYLKTISERMELLQDDFQMLEDVETQLDEYRADMLRDFDFRLSDVDNVLYEMEQRGEAYFDETMRLGRVFDLIKKERIQREFEVQVVGDVPQRIEKKTAEMIDWSVDADLRQWQAVTEHIADRRRKHKDRIVGGDGAGNFHYDRERLIEGIGQEARRVVDSYDKTKEAQHMAQGAQNAVAATAALQIGAVGLGAVIAAIATTLAADVTGILLAGLVAALGLFIIPARRNKAKKEMRTKVADMRHQLTKALRGHFNKEIERSLQHINDTVAPYTRFVRAERNKNTDVQETLQVIQIGLSRLQTQINDL